MQVQRNCDLYNPPEEDCECNTICGLPHDDCPEHSPARPVIGRELLLWPSPPTSISSCPPTPKNEQGESAPEILDKYETYNELKSVYLALSTSASAAALHDYHTELSERDFKYMDQEVLEQFSKTVKFESERGDREEVDVYEMAEGMVGSYILLEGTWAGKVLVAARRYRMILQRYGGWVGADEDILREVESVLARAEERDEVRVEKG